VRIRHSRHHDLGFETDQRTGGVTHHIDPAVDDEREFVGQTLNATGLVSGVDHAAPADALKGDFKTATGGGFQSDGRVLVIVLK
jgi:LssY-like putative type I secretion system component LssY